MFLILFIFCIFILIICYKKTREIELSCQFVDEWIERVALKTSKANFFLLRNMDTEEMPAPLDINSETDILKEGLTDYLESDI
jgi:hypothetical protein